MLLGAEGSAANRSVMSPQLEAQLQLDQQHYAAPISRRMLSAAIDALCIGAGLAGFAAVAVKLPGTLCAGLPRPLLIGAAAGMFVSFAVMYQLLFFTLNEATPGMRAARVAFCTFARRIRRARRYGGGSCRPRWRRVRWGWGWCGGCWIAIGWAGTIACRECIRECIRAIVDQRGFRRRIGRHDHTRLNPFVMVAMSRRRACGWSPAARHGIVGGSPHGGSGVKSRDCRHLPGTMTLPSMTALQKDWLL